MNWFNRRSARLLAADSQEEFSTTVLVVEDDDTVRDYVCSWCQMVGLAASPASSGEEAIEILDRDRSLVRAIVTDGVMSGIDGFEFARRAAHVVPAVPVILLSGVAALFSGRSDLPPNIVAIYPKPFSGQELVAELRELMNRKAEPAALGRRGLPPVRHRRTKLTAPAIGA